MCSCHSILECCVTFSGVKLSIRSFVLFIWKDNRELVILYSEVSCDLCIKSIESQRVAAANMAARTYACARGVEIS